MRSRRTTSPQRTRRSQRIQNSWRVLLCVLCALCGNAFAVEAQNTAIIRGTVVQADSTTRVPGIVIVALDSARNEIARALSGQNGGYQMTVPAPATYALRALRIGYRPTTLPTVTVAPGETHEIRAVLNSLTVVLSEVRVREGQGSCRIAAEVGKFVGDLWEQARTVLAASTLSADNRPFEATMALYRHFTPKNEKAIAAETLEVVKRTTTTGFVSVSAEELLANGYVNIVGSKISYHSPDANAFLSPLFATTHCFDVKLGGSEHPDWIGIAFRPAARRPGIADIEGTLWLDRGSAELRTLEFRYVNLPRNAANGDADGRVTFVRLLTGDWIISRWHIRTPETEETSGMGRITTFKPIGQRVVGGLTQSIEQDGHQLFRDRGAAVTFILRPKDGVNHPRGAIIGIDGLERGALTDTLGGVTVTGLTEGRHKAHILSNVMAWVDAKPIIREFDAIYDKPGVVEVELPLMKDIGTTACAQANNSAVTAYFGVVRDAKDEPMSGVRVVISWIGNALANRRQRRANPVGDEISRVAFTDAAGRWRLCVPPAVGASISVESGDKLLLEPRKLLDAQPRPYEPIELKVP